MKEIFMEYFNIIMGTLIVIMILAFLQIAVQVSDNNPFASVVSDVVSRHGGLTKSALEEIENYNQTIYGGRYEVMSEVSDRVGYGEVINIQLITRLKLFYFEIPADIGFQASAVSKRR
ncbi:hypothetical protein [Erysipelothrix anatis]|uniref:hypothetical protein n=1 Tax=Erysipelothrix anatis TaxID=2683713 RepID=UPI0014082EC4|nr:hypothetical protein [Erysipelothrix anatis]